MKNFSDLNNTRINIPLNAPDQVTELGLTLQSKLEPLFDTQMYLTDQTKDFNSYVSCLNDRVLSANLIPQSVNNLINCLGSDLLKVGNIATISESLLKIPTLDFINEPLLSTLNFVTESIKQAQSSISYLVPNTISELDSLTFEVTKPFEQMGFLRGLTLDYLGSSSIIPPTLVVGDLDGEGKIKERLEKLEMRLDEVEDRKRDARLSIITKNVADLLEEISPDLARCFRGAIDTLLIDQSEDLVAQVAESLTRLVEDLPLALSKTTIFSSQKKDEQIKEALGSFLGLPTDQRNTHQLIRQQQGFYIVLSDIRHRNLNVYPKYNNDRNLFKALVLQVESFIYTLATYE